MSSPVAQGTNRNLRPAAGCQCFKSTRITSVGSKLYVVKKRPSSPWRRQFGRCLMRLRRHKTSSSIAGTTVGAGKALSGLAGAYRFFLKVLKCWLFRLGASPKIERSQEFDDNQPS